MYTVVHGPDGKARLRRTADGAIIPKALGNRDYAEYLVWRSEQNPPPDDEDQPPVELAVSGRRPDSVAAFLEAASAAPAGAEVLAAIQKRMMLDWIAANPEQAQAIAETHGLSLRIDGPK